MSRALSAITNPNYKHFDGDGAELENPTSAAASFSTNPESSRAASTITPDPPRSTVGASTLTLDPTTLYDSNRISTFDTTERSRRQRLIWIQLCCSILIFLLECVSTGLSSGSYWGFGAALCHVGTGIWVGLLGIVGALLGIVSLKKIDSNSPSKLNFTTAYLIMSILQTLADGLLTLLATACMTQAVAYLTYAKANQSAYPYLVTKESHMTVVALNVIMTVLGVVHIIANILAAILVCRSWWLTAARADTPMTTVYVSETLTTGRLPTLCIEKGSRVTFLPTSTSTVANGH